MQIKTMDVKRTGICGGLRTRHGLTRFSHFWSGTEPDEGVDHDSYASPPASPVKNKLSSCSVPGESPSKDCVLFPHLDVSLRRSLESTLDASTPKELSLSPDQLDEEGEGISIVQTLKSLDAEDQPLQDYASTMATFESAEEGFRCSVCREMFASLPDLALHQLWPQTQALYACLECDGTYSSCWHFISHQLEHTSGEVGDDMVWENVSPHRPRTGQQLLVSVQDICHSFFDDGPSARESICLESQDVATKGRGVCCSVCAKTFVNRSSLLRHMFSHTAPMKHRCRICANIFKTRLSLNKHVLKHARQKKQYPCDICMMPFPGRKTLAKHMLKHGKARKHQCPACSESFAFKKDLSTHMLIHRGQNEHSCSICIKSFKRRDSLNRHVRMHTGQGLHTCNVCGKLLSSKAALSKHMLRHSGQRSPSCDLCGKVFVGRSSLKRHMLRHSEGNLHSCILCGQSYLLLTSLTRHMRKHEEGQTHSCSICGKSYPLRSSLKRHMVSHFDRKLHPCSVCGKSFRIRSNLSRHMLKHTEGKMHSCTICGKSFSLQSNLTRHMQSHAERKVYSCESSVESHFLVDLL